MARLMPGLARRILAQGFVDHSAPVIPQTLLLGALSIAVAGVSDLAYVLARR
jgi:hypothetical protein